MKRHTMAFSVVILFAVSFLGNLVNAIDSSPLSLTLKAQSDCYVSENNRDSTYGREVVLNVRSYSDGKYHYNHRIYIQFNISALPKDAVILSALLWLYKNPEGANPGVRNIQAFKVTSAWNEYTLNWNNQPDVSSRPATSTYVSGAFKWYSWNLIQDVRAWHNGSTLNHGTMLRDEAEDSGIDYASVFLSREASHPENPFLEIEYAKSLRETAMTTQEPSIVSQIPTYAWVAIALSATIFTLAGLAWTIAKGRKSSRI